MSLPALSIAQPRQVATKLFGTLDVEAEHVLHATEGLCGFPACHEWVLLDGARAGTAWLQSVDFPTLAFLLADPFTAFEGYAVDLAQTELDRLGADEASEIAVFGIVTLPLQAGEPASVNLAAPLVIDVDARRVVQVIISDGRWSVRANLPASLLG